MRSYRTLLVYGLIALITLFDSCDKTPDPGFHYTFENLSDKPVNVDVYATLNDYNNGTNVIMTGRAGVRGYAVFPLDKFTPKQLYFADWYSDDYTYTNWYWSNVTLTDTFTPSKDNFQFIINKVEFADPSRSIWLKNSAPQTVWKAVDAYTYSGGVYTSTWSSLTTAQQNVQITLHKNFTSNILAQGVDTAIHYKANYNTSTSQSIIMLINRDSTAYGNLTSNFSAATKGFSASQDTLLAYFNGLGYYAMARQ